MSNSCEKVNCGSLLPEVRTDVLLQHAAESRPQVVESPVKRVDAVAQGVTAEGTNLGSKNQQQEVTWPPSFSFLFGRAECCEGHTSRSPPDWRPHAHCPPFSIHEDATSYVRHGKSK